MDIRAYFKSDDKTPEADGEAEAERGWGAALLAGGGVTVVRGDRRGRTWRLLVMQCTGALEATASYLLGLTWRPLLHPSFSHITRHASHASSELVPALVLVRGE
jgi:hypothetical protein